MGDGTHTGAFRASMLQGLLWSDSVARLCGTTMVACFIARCTAAFAGISASTCRHRRALWARSSLKSGIGVEQNSASCIRDSKHWGPSFWDRVLVRVLLNNPCRHTPETEADRSRRGQTGAKGRVVGIQDVRKAKVHHLRQKARRWGRAIFARAKAYLDDGIWQLRGQEEVAGLQVTMEDLSGYRAALCPAFRVSCRSGLCRMAVAQG